MPQNGLKLHTPFLKGGPLNNSKKGGLRQLPHSPYPISTTAYSIIFIRFILLCNCLCFGL